MTALLLEDDPILSSEIQRFLESRGISCHSVTNGDDAAMAAEADRFDIFLLDINVPGRNGLEVCREIRLTDTQTPVLMLTAYGDIQDKADAFGVGADDYLVKPFHFDELMMRIQSLTRRTSQSRDSGEVLTEGDLEIHVEDMMVKRAGKTIDLTPREYQLLLLLMRAHGRTLSKQAIAEQIWDVRFDSNLNTIEVYINFLRKKMDKGFSVKLIHTRPGFGYYLKAEHEE